MSLFLNLLFESDSYSNIYLLANFGFDTAENEPENEPYKVREIGNSGLRNFLCLFPGPGI